MYHLKKNKTVFVYFFWKESLAIINYYIVKKVSNKTKLQYLMLLILWLLSQCRVMALYWKHSGTIKLPGDTKVLLVQQPTMYDFSLIFFFNLNDQFWTYWQRCQGFSPHLHWKAQSYQKSLVL